MPAPACWSCRLSTKVSACPVLEAMTFGVPVVASNRGALPEVLGDAGPLVDPDDPAAIAAAIGRLLDDDGYAARLRRQRSSCARGQFNWDRTARLVYDVYVQAVEARKQAARTR